MTKKNLILEQFADTEDVVFADGFDDAIIGFDPNLWKVVYSRNRCIEILMKEGDSELDAIDYLEYNTFNAYVGEKTPVWVEDFLWDCE
jgi:hypothetical protein